MLKGAAVIGMVLLHLFCRLGDLPYTPLIWINDVPLIYYIGLFGDLCVPLFAFLSGYAHFMQYNENERKYKNNICKLSRFILNVWIVILLISFLGLLFDRSGQIPGSIGKFVRCLLLVDTYAGAWWYITIYIFLVFLSLVLYKATDRFNSLTVLLTFLCLYAGSHLLRFNYAVSFGNPVVSWVYEKAVLFFNTSFSYIVGMLYRKHKIISKIRNKYRSNSKVLFAGILLVFLFHCFFQSVVVAPFNAFVFLTVLLVVDLPNCIREILIFFGKHSTNIWLYHMFFYLVLFPGLVFKAKWPILIIAFMIFICVSLSFITNEMLNVVLGKWRKARWIN